MTTMLKTRKSKVAAIKSKSLDSLVIADARRMSDLLGQAEGFIDTIITSPPYGDLIDYRVPDQLGHGQTWDAYLGDLTSVFETCYRLLKETGSLWVVVDVWRERKNYRLLPLEIANKASALGWKLQDVIIWDKQHTLPYYQRGQFRPTYEHILFFSKTDKFKFYIDRIREFDGLSIWWMDFPERFNPQGKSPTNIWHFPIRPQGAWRGTREKWRHACPFPTEMVARIIELTTDKGDVVFDPFAGGSGVVLATAAAMDRHYLGLEINREFVAQFNSIVKDEIAREWATLNAKRKAMNRLNGSFGSLLLKLRVLKYARKATAAIQSRARKLNSKNGADQLNLQLCVCLVDLPETLEKGDILQVSLYYLYSGPKEKFLEATAEANTLLNEFPLSNYRIKPTIRGFKQKATLKKAFTKHSNLYLYLRLKPRSFDAVQSVKQLWTNGIELPKGNAVPILSNLEVDVNWMAESYGKAVIQGLSKKTVQTL